MFKKAFLSPFFMPVFFVLLWAMFLCYTIFFNNGNEAILAVTKEGGIIEDISHVGYIFLIALLLLVSNDYRDKIRSWGIYLFLAICAFLREEGIHHHLSRTDTTPFKSRFFLNPNNALSEKIVFGIFLLVILCAVIYLANKYAKHLVKSFFKFDTISWSIAVMCGIGVVSKYIDRFPANWRKAHGGVKLSDDVYTMFQLVEESMEMFLPYIACFILIQYHYLHAEKK